MTDRGPYGQDPDPTEVFPPLRPDPPTPPATLPPVGADRDPDPTRVMQPDEPGTVPPTGGPYDPGPPYGGGGGGGEGGGGEPPFEPEPEPWYRQPGPLAALIAGVAALIVALIALIIWTSGGDDDSANDTLPTVASTVPETTATTSSSTTTTTEPATTTSSSTKTTTSSTTTSTTTTLPPTTTTTTTPPTTAAPTTTTTTTPITNPPPGATSWDVISATPSLSAFKAAISGSNTEGFFQGTTKYTILAPDNDAMKNATNFDVTDYITEGAISSAELFDMQEIAMQSKAVLKIDNTTQTIGGAVMTASRDIKVSNGVINVMAGLVTSEGP